MTAPKKFEPTWDHTRHVRRPAGGEFIAHRPAVTEYEGGDDRHACISCGKWLRSTDPGSLFRNECRECQEPKSQGPAVAFVRWQGVVLGFDSLEKAIGFVRNAKEASDPRYYCGPPVELPELIETPEVQEAKR